MNGIENEIRTGIEEVLIEQEDKERQAALQENASRERADRAARIRPYLERFRAAARGQHPPKTIRCRMPRRVWGLKLADRHAWLISMHYGDPCDDVMGCPEEYLLWLDYEERYVWWQQTGRVARSVSLGSDNPDLSLEGNRVLEEAEKDLARNIGKAAALMKIDLISPGR